MARPMTDKEWKALQKAKRDAESAAKRRDREAELEAKRREREIEEAIKRRKREEREAELEAKRREREREEDIKRRKREEREAEMEVKRKEREREDAEKKQKKEQREAELRAKREQDEAEVKAKQDKKTAEKDARGAFEYAKTLYKTNVPLIREFPDEFACVAIGLTAEDGFTAEELTYLPMANLRRIATHEEAYWRAYKRYDVHLLSLATRAFEAQVARAKLWQRGGAQGRLGDIVQQGDAGFNRHATNVLMALDVRGSTECTMAPPFPPMLHQATTRVLFHPFTPIRRALVVHPTGTGKSNILLNVIESFFHDPRPKIVITPTHGYKVQYMQDLLTLFP